jgi:RNA polymerase sigma-70 factor (ECF subfamily)
MHTDIPNQFEQLLQAAKAGSKEALGQMLEPYWEQLHLIAQRCLDRRCHLRPKGSGSDLVQDTMMVAVKQFHQFQGHDAAELLAWLSYLLFQQLRDFRRRYEATSKRAVAREVSLDWGDLTRTDQARMASDDVAPENEATLQDEIQRVRAALERLPTHYQEVLVLKFRHDCSYEQIGRRIGRPRHAARMLCCRAVQKVRTELQKLKSWP